MRYHHALEAELQDVAAEFFDTPLAWRARLQNGLIGALIAQSIESSVVPELVPIRVLGRESPKDFWFDVGLRDTIERAWHREDKYFGRAIKEG